MRTFLGMAQDAETLVKQTVHLRSGLVLATVGKTRDQTLGNDSYSSQKQSDEYSPKSWNLNNADRNQHVMQTQTSPVRDHVIKLCLLAAHLSELEMLRKVRYRKKINTTGYGCERNGDHNGSW